MSANNEARTAEVNVNETTNTEATPEAKSEAKKASAKSTAKRTSTKSKGGKLALAATKIKELAHRSWWRKASKARLAEEFGITEDQIDEVRASKQYKDIVQSLLTSQWPDLEKFNKWVKSYGNTTTFKRNFGARMGIDKDEVMAMIEYTRGQHALIAEGEAKAPKPVQNPHKKDS